ncbi:hypothetical protein V7S43_016937 [Phytophthora oleae]|uniref:Uncharacterized protein n=1 Tax=Phytophthora oleae TaxID=2107226 RepID=A0ABD3EVB6_9STRA
MTNKTGGINPAKLFTLADVTAWSVQRARQIRKADFERFVKLHNFFTASDDAVARPINSKTTAKREQIDQWVRAATNAKTLACLQEVQETQQALLALITVSAAISKYGEQELARREKLGEMDNVIGVRFGTSSLRSKRQIPHTVGASFVLRLVLGLAPKKRAACQVLIDIITYASNERLVLTPTTKGLKPMVGGAPDSGDWDRVNQYKLKYMVKQAQSTKFQEAVQQLGGQRLYDAIRTQLKQAGAASMWNDAKDKPALQQKNVRPQGKQHQPAKKSSGQKEAAKKHLPVPPPTPVKATANVQVKNVEPLGGWSRPLPASILQSKPRTIVSSTPTIGARTGNIGRVILSKAL